MDGGRRSADSGCHWRDQESGESGGRGQKPPSARGDRPGTRRVKGEGAIMCCRTKESWCCWRAPTEPSQHPQTRAARAPRSGRCTSLCSQKRAIWAPGSCEARTCAAVALDCTSTWGRGRAAWQKNKDGNKTLPWMNVSQKTDYEAGCISNTRIKTSEGIKRKPRIRNLEPQNKNRQKKRRL